MNELRFTNCKNYYGKKNEDIFKQFKDEDLKLMGIYKEKERRIPFNPVETNPGAPIRMAFIGLNAYCGTDFKEAYKQINFTEWCQERYNTKIFSVMNRYKDGLQNKVGNFSIYYTNYVKVVLPQDNFKQADDVCNMLTESRHIKNVFDLEIEKEINHLAKDDCRVFIGFGNDVSDILKNILNLNYDVFKFHMNGLIDQDCYFISERHYSRYGINNTDKWIMKLKKVTF